MSGGAGQNLISFNAGADLSSSQFFGVDLDSSGNVVAAGDGAVFIGILQNKPASGGQALVCVSGKCKAIAGGSVTAGQSIASDGSGEMVTAVPGDFAKGVAAESASDGEIFSLVLMPHTNHVGLLDADNLATVANDNALGGLLVTHVTAVAGGAAANEDITVTDKFRVIDCWAQHTGGAGEANDTIQLFNGANAISDAMDWSGVDNAIVRAGSLDDAYTEVAAAGTLRVTTVDNDSGGDVGAGLVYTLGILVA